MRKTVNAMNLGKDDEEFIIGDTEFEMSIRLLSGNVEQAIGNTSMGFKKIQAGDTCVKMAFKAMRWNAIANKSECG